MTDIAPTADAGPSDLSLAVIHLFKGPVYRDTHEKVWALLLGLRNQIADYVAVLGVQVIIDEAEGYGYLRSRPTGDDTPEIPRLVARRTLSFHISVLLALLRKRLAEFDASSADIRLVLTRAQIMEMLRLFLPESSNDVRLVDAVDAHINKVVDMGFLRRLRSEVDSFEVRRILKAYVDGQWLSDFDTRLDEYLAELGLDEEDA
ncbi:MAG: Uncharacterized protein JWO62_3268 [Acidimicrobiaceae bacterium]|nr:Uncharacterized protein [Acidimicrobiaceae bacterium]